MEETQQKTTIQEEKMIFSQNLAFFRKKLGLSQTALGNKIQYSNKNISKWEQGETIPDIFTIKKLAAIFNISVDTLINPLSEDNKNAITTRQVAPLKWKIYMLLLIDSIILLSASIIFYIMQVSNFSSFPPIFVFIYILPIIDLSIFIFLCCVNKKVNTLTLSLIGWLTAICIHIKFLKTPNIYYIYILAAAYQLLAIFFAKLINSGKIIKLNKLLIFKRKKNKAS